MRKDSIDPKALENAYLIYSEKGHTIEGYDFSHTPTDYARGTVQEPERTSKLRDVYHELTPPSVRQAEYNAAAAADENLEAQIERLQGDMSVSRRLGNFQALQSQMKKLNALMKEKQRNDARMAVNNLGAAQMNVYGDTMDPDYTEMRDIGERIASLEQKVLEYMESKED